MCSKKNLDQKWESTQLFVVLRLDQPSQILKHMSWFGSYQNNNNKIMKNIDKCILIFLGV